MKCQIMKSITKKCGKEAVSKWNPYIGCVTVNIPICKDHRDQVLEYIQKLKP